MYEMTSLDPDIEAPTTHETMTTTTTKKKVNITTHINT